MTTNFYLRLQANVCHTLFFHSCHGGKVSLKQEDVNRTLNTCHFSVPVVWSYDFGHSTVDTILWNELALPIINNLKALDWDVDHHGRQLRDILFPADFSRPPVLLTWAHLQSRSAFCHWQAIRAICKSFLQTKNKLWQGGVGLGQEEKKNLLVYFCFSPSSSSSSFFYSLSKLVVALPLWQTKLEWEDELKAEDTLARTRFWLKNSKYWWNMTIKVHQGSVHVLSPCVRPTSPTRCCLSETNALFIRRRESD